MLGYGLRQACLVVLLVVVGIGSVYAGGPVVTSMGGAGAAVPGSLSAIFLNPAGAGRIEGPQMYGTLQLAGDADGIQRVFAYTEPDSGFGAGILGVVRSREATGVDTSSGDVLYDSANAWSYVVAKELWGGNSVGLRAVYETTQSDERSATGSGYRFDAGLVHDLGDGLYAALSVDNLLDTGITWSDGVTERYGRKVTAGIAYVHEMVTIALDVEGTADLEEMAVRGGIEGRWNGLSLSGGFVHRGDQTAFSSGAGYRRGPWRVDYAYVPDSGTHELGVSWSL